MVLNTIEAKCITFQKKNKVNKNDTFHINGTPLANVNEFVYLGLELPKVYFQDTVKDNRYFSPRPNSNSRNFRLCFTVSWK